MKLTCDLSHIVSLFRNSAALLEAKTTLPISGHILLTAQNNLLTIQATDLETGFQGSCEAKIKTPGTVTLPGKKALEILRELSGETVEITQADSQNVKIQSGGSKFTIQGLPPNEFPSIRGLDTPLELDLPREDFETLLREVIPSIGEDQSRFILNTVRAEISGTTTPKLRLVSTNGHRLSMAEKSMGTWRSKPENDHKIMIAKKAATLIVKLLGESDQVTVGVGITKNLLVLQIGSVRLASRLVDGNYPNYNQVIPKKLAAQMEIDGPQFAEALRRVAVMAESSSPAVDLTLSEDGLKIETQNPNLGNANETLAATIGVERLETRLNARYLIESIQTAPSKNIRFHMEDGLKPCILTNGDVSRWLTVIMPINKPNKAAA